MTLALGTALQNGTYVIDALHGEDSVGPLYLATHVPSGQWVVVRVLGSRHPEALPDVTQRTAFYAYLDSLNQLGQALLPRHLGGFEEDRVCYQTFTLPQGIPLSQRVTPQNPMPLAPSLALIRRLAQDLQTLHPLGWFGLRLTPDQVWQDAEGALRVFGFDFPAGQSTAPAWDDAALVPGLTELLYFLLTGQWAAQSPLGVDLCYRRPDLPTHLAAVFQWGGVSRAPALPTSLEAWLALLPDPNHLPPKPWPGVVTATPTPQGETIPPTPQDLPQPRPTATILATPASSPPRAAQPSSPHPPRQGLGLTGALLATGLVFGIGGGSLGLHARLNPNSPAGQSRFNPNQAFPPLPDWGQRSAEFANPTVEGRPSRLNQPPSPLFDPTVGQPPLGNPGYPLDPAAAPALGNQPPPAVPPTGLSPINEVPDSTDLGTVSPDYPRNPPKPSAAGGGSPPEAIPAPVAPPPAPVAAPAPTVPANPIPPTPLAPAPVAPAPVTPPPDPLTSS